jgi:hypothetical protein
MEEIALQIHSEGQEPHEITAPPGIETEEFIRELVAGLHLPGDLIWEADDKDTGHTLAPGKTLHQNGVRSGHHLYLKSRPIPAKPHPFPGGPDPIPPRPDPQRPSGWPLILAIALIPVAGVAAYSLGTGRNQQLSADLRDAHALAADANQRASAAEAKAAQLQQQFDDVQQKAGGANAQVSQLSQQITQLSQELDRRQKQIKADQTKISDITQNVNDLRANAAKDQEQMKRLEASSQAATQQAANLQNEVNAKQQIINTLQARSSSTGKEKQAPARPSYGWLIWNGDLPRGNVVEVRDNRPSVGSLSGRLPGTPCAVEPADPDNVSIEAAPDSGTAWNRVVFRVKNKNKAPVRLLWVAR